MKGLASLLVLAAALGDRPAGMDGGDDAATPAAGAYGPNGDQELETLPPPGLPTPDKTVAPAGSAAPAAPGGPANMHIVKRGDTLSKLARRYFQDPYRWPKIWALNPEITNPHWIYPGQALRLRANPRVAPPAPPTPPAAAEPPPPAVAGTLPSRAGLPMLELPELRQVGFVDEGDLKAAGVISGSMEEKILLGSGDHAYVEFPADKQPKGGSRYSVYQVDLDHPIREPLSTTVLGYLVHVYGEVVIDTLTDRPVANGRLVDLVEPVERGYRVSAQIRRLRSVRPKHNELDMTARIVAAVQPNLLIANAMFVVLNRGSRHGVELGNRFLVLRQGDGIKRVMEDWEGNDYRFPPHAVAEIVAVDVANETTVGWISRGTRELHTGDVADMRRGY